MMEPPLPRAKNKTVIKILVLGSSNVGKTSLMTRYATGTFTGQRMPTVGADFMTKRVILDEREVTMQIWDTAGQERFHQGTLGSAFYRGANGALLCYDVNNVKSQEQLCAWRDECLQQKLSGAIHFPVVVIGNKVDLRDAMDPASRADQTPVLDWCKDNGYGHVETSAKDGLGVEAAMNAIAGLAMEAMNTLVCVC